MDHAFSDYERLGREGGVFSLDDHCIIEFSGTEWKDWLQGQITNDIRLLTPEKSLSFCLCKPTGQILAPGDLHEVDGKGWMVVPLSAAPAVLQRVEQMVILEDCVAHILDHILTHHIPGSDGLPAKRTLWPGHDSHLLYEGELLSRDAYLLATLEAEIPLWGDDIDEFKFPAEMGSAYEAKTMSYTKGCYTGQEVNHRLFSRGHTNKTWGVYVSEHELQAGHEVHDSEGTKIGTVTRSAHHPGYGWLVGAFVKNETIPTLTRFQP